MGTNGGCHCINGIELDKRLAVRRILVDYGRLERRIAELEKALREVAEHPNNGHPCDCETGINKNDVIIPCQSCIAKKALEAK